MNHQMNGHHKTITPQWKGGDEPSLSDMISNPLVRILMSRDKISRNELLALIDMARRYVCESSQPPSDASEARGDPLSLPAVPVLSQ